MLILEVKKLGTKKFSNLPNIRNLGAVNQDSVLGWGWGRGEVVERDWKERRVGNCSQGVKQTDRQTNKGINMVLSGT